LNFGRIAVKYNLYMAGAFEQVLSVWCDRRANK